VERSRGVPRPKLNTAKIHRLARFDTYFGALRVHSDVPRAAFRADSGIGDRNKPPSLDNRLIAPLHAAESMIHLPETKERRDVNEMSTMLERAEVVDIWSTYPRLLAEIRGQNPRNVPRRERIARGRYRFLADLMSRDRSVGRSGCIVLVARNLSLLRYITPRTCTRVGSYQPPPPPSVRHRRVERGQEEEGAYA